MAVDAGQAAKYRGRHLDDIDIDGQYGTPFNYNKNVCAQSLAGLKMKT